MPKLMQQLAEIEGECCILAYFLNRTEMSHEELEARLGISMEQIVHWRRKIRKGKVTCRRLPECSMGITSECLRAFPRKPHQPSEPAE